jgi:dynactin complex subunit
VCCHLLQLVISQDFDPNGRTWIGVELTRPIGKHNGSVRGKKYFQAEEKHGTFVQPKQASNNRHSSPHCALSGTGLILKLNRAIVP